MPLPNSTPQTAQVIAGFPVIWQASASDMSPPYRTWYVYTPVTGDTYLSILPYRHRWKFILPTDRDVVQGRRQEVCTRMASMYGLPILDSAILVRRSKRFPSYLEHRFTLNYRNQGGGTLASIAFEILFNINPRATASPGSILHYG